MSHWLYLAPASSHCCWWGADGQLHQGELAQAASALALQRVNLLLPMEWASYHQVQLPPRSGRWLRQALASALEEQLVDEVAQLHLALGPLKPGQPTAVLALKRQLLADCLAQLQRHGITPQHVYVDADCLGHGQPRALLLAQRWLLGGRATLRLALTEAELHDLQPLLPADLCWQGPLPAAWPSANQQMSELPSQPWLQLSQGAAQAIDLRQAEFILRAPRRRLWQVSLALLLGAVLAQCGQFYLLRHSVQQRSAELAHSSTELWQQRFAEQLDASNLSHLAEMIRSKQHNILQPNGLALRLSQLALQWQASHGALAQVQRLDYQHDEGWHLQVSAAAFADLQQLREGLLEQGMDASIESSVREPSGVSARFQIKD